MSFALTEPFAAPRRLPSARLPPAATPTERTPLPALSYRLNAYRLNASTIADTRDSLMRSLVCTYGPREVVSLNALVTMASACRFRRDVHRTSPRGAGQTSELFAGLCGDTVLPSLSRQLDPLARLVIEAPHVARLVKGVE